MTSFRIGLITAIKNDPRSFYARMSISLGPLALESYILSKMKDVIFCVADDIRDVISFRPDLVGISSTSENYPIAIEYARLVKNKLNIPVVIGGNHITSCPKSFSNVFDIGIIGEGEESFRQILEYHKNGKGDLEKIDGIIYWNGKKLIKNPDRKVIGNIDIFPMPNRRKWVDRVGVAHIMGSRGCPYKCYFCAACRMWPNYREHSVDYIIRELKDIVNSFRPPFIRFFDDLFTIDKKRLKNLTKKMIEEGLTEDTAYICWTRANLLDQEMAEILKNANFVNVAFGAESGSSQVLKKIKDGKVTSDDNQRTIDILYANGIKVGCAFIIGAPEETEDDLKKTYEFIERNMDKINDVEINPLIPYPGTPLWRYAEKRGLVDVNMDWSKLFDTAMVTTFDFDKYIYLNEKIPFKNFMAHVERFKKLYNQINTKPSTVEFAKRYYPIYQFPARLKKPAS